jgi:hypothetical protein
MYPFLVTSSLENTLVRSLDATWMMALEQDTRKARTASVISLSPEEKQMNPTHAEPWLWEERREGK